MTSRARTSDPMTSHEAAEQVGRFEHGHYALIRQALMLGTGTAEEIAERCGLEYHAVARRLPEMARRSEAMPTDEIGFTSTGRRARIWTFI